MSGQRFFWLKLPEDFFSSKRIKKLRRLAGGDTLTIIYLKLQLLAIRSGGIIRFSGLESTIYDELALDLDEDPSNVQMCIQYLLSTGLAEASDESALLLPWAVANTGSETSSARRMREARDRLKTQELPERAQCAHIVAQCATDAPDGHAHSDGEKELELEPELEKEKESLLTQGGISAADAPSFPQPQKEPFSPEYQSAAEALEAIVDNAIAGNRARGVYRPY